MDSTLASVSTTQAPTPATRKLRPVWSLLPYVRPYGRQIALALLFLALAAGATLALPAAVRDLVDHGLVQPAGIELAARMAQVRLRFLELFAIAVALAVFTAARFYMVSWIGERVTADLRRAVYAHVLRQSPQFFETLKTGEVLSRLTADATVIQGAVGSSLSMGLRSLVMALGAIGMLVATNPRLMLAVVGVITLVVLPALGIGRRVRHLSRASQDRIADTSGIAGEVLNAVPVVQSYTQENAETLRFARSNEMAFATAMRRAGTRAGLTTFLIDAAFFSQRNENAAQDRGVKRVAIPNRSTKSAERKALEKKRWFRNAQKWRTGSEGRISLLKRRHGLSRCRYKGMPGIKRWVGFGVIADNLINIGHVLAASTDL